MMICITLFLFPLLYGYHHGNKDTSLADKPSQNALFKLTLGSLGGASVLCEQSRVTKGQIQFSCPAGRIELSQAYGWNPDQSTWDQPSLNSSLFHFGVVSTKAMQKNACNEWAVFNNKVEEDTTFSSCSKFLNPRAFKEAFAKKCDKASSCKVEFDPKEMFLAGVEKFPECNTEKAYLYARVPCLIGKESWNQRMIYCLIGSSLSVFVFLYTLVYFDYIKTVQKNKYVDWDMQTITAGDYTIEFDVKRQTYKHWQDHYFDKTSILPEAAQFRTFIWKELETLCSA